MQKVHIRAVWVPDSKMFSLKFQIMDIDGSSPAFWDIPPDNFLKMVEHAERQLQVRDGQNRVGKVNLHYEVVDKHNNDVEINLLDCDRATFSQMTAYLRKVYDSWKGLQNG